MSECYIHVCISHACLVATVAIRGNSVPLGLRSQSVCEHLDVVLGTEPCRQQVLLAAEPSLQHGLHFLPGNKTVLLLFWLGFMFSIF